MGADFGGDAGGASNLMIFQGLLKPFIGVGCLSLPGVTKDGGIVYFSLLLVILTYVASWCIFKLVECSELIMKAETLRNMFQRKLNERYANVATSDKADKSNVSDLSILTASQTAAPQVQLFEQVPGYSEADITEEDKRHVTLPTFTEIGTVAYGYWGGVLTDASIIITQIGGCTAYVIFISGSMHEVTGLHRMIWVAIMWLPFVLLSFIRNMANLAKIASLGNFVYIYTLGVIFYQGFKSHCCVPAKELNLGEYTKLPAVFGSLSFALEGIALVLPIKQRMATPQSFTWVMTAAMTVIFFIYFSVAVFGYLFYGEHTLSPVIGNLEPGPLADSVKIALCISLYITFGLQCFPVSHFFDQLVDNRWYKLNFAELREHALALPPEDAPILSPRCDDEIDPQTVDLSLATTHPQTHIHLSEEQLVPDNIRFSRYMMQNLHRLLYVSLCCGIAILFPQFDLIISLFGSFSNALLAYIFPALFWVKICSPYIFTGKLWFPFTRSGEKLPHEDADNGSDVSSFASSDGDISGSLSESNSKKGSIQSVASETDPLFNTKRASPTLSTKQTSSTTRFFMLVFPYTVAVLGSIASAIGVTMAVKNLIHEFGNKD